MPQRNWMRKLFKAVVVDGTAEGILGKLPSFERNSSTLSVKYQVRTEQQIFPTRAQQTTEGELFKFSRSAFAPSSMNASLC